MSFPRMLRLSQKFEGPELADVQQETRSQLAALELGDKIRPGESVAITAGSRGIANIASIIKAASRHLKDIGAKPFVVPAMGSHGGGTAEGTTGDPSQLRRHRGIHWRPDPLLHGDGHRSTRTPQGIPGPFRPPRLRGGSRRRLRPGQAPLPVSSVPSSRAFTR